MRHVGNQLHLHPLAFHLLVHSLRHAMADILKLHHKAVKVVAGKITADIRIVALSDFSHIQRKYLQIPGRLHIFSADSIRQYQESCGSKGCQQSDDNSGGGSAYPDSFISPGRPSYDEQNSHKRRIGSGPGKEGCIPHRRFP